MRAVLVVPLTIRERTIGALTMVNAESGRSFDRGDLEFAEQIAARAALAVESARLYSERSAIARTLQDSLLPEAIPEIPGWEFAALYRPAGQEGEVGGDFYDFWELDGEWLMVIGDVTGKGVGAAAVTSLVRHTARAASEFDPRPAQMLARIDAALRRRPTRLAVHGPVPAHLTRRRDARRRWASTAAVHRRGRGERDRRARHAARRARSERAGRKRASSCAPARRSSRSPTASPTRSARAASAGAPIACGPRWPTRAGSPRRRSGARLVPTLDEFQVGAQADDTAVVIMRYSGESSTGGRLDQLSSVGARGNG